MEKEIQLRILQEGEKIKAIQGVMDKCYQNMKDKLGIDEMIEDQNSDRETQEAFRELRPKAKSSLKETMSRENDPERRRKANLMRIKLHSKQRRERYEKGEYQLPNKLRYPVGKLQSKQEPRSVMSTSRNKVKFNGLTTSNKSLYGKDTFSMKSAEGSKKMSSAIKEDSEAAFINRLKKNIYNIPDLGQLDKQLEPPDFSNEEEPFVET